MDENAKRGIAAYQKNTPAANVETGGGDWLARLAQEDFGVEDAAEASAKAGGTAPPAGKAFIFPALSPSEPALEKVTRAEPIPVEPLDEPKYRRVAKFLILIGSEQAAKVLENLDDEQVEAIMREIAAISVISADDARRVLAEFHNLLSGAYQFGGASRGGVDAARALLYAAFGQERGELVLRRSVQETGAGIFGFLEDFSGEQVMTLLRDESPAAGAMILSRLKPEISAAALKAADEDWRNEVVRRIAKLGHIAPEVLEKAAESLREKARHIGSAETADLDGMGALAAILKHTDLSFGDKILSELAETDAGLSRDIKERLFTLDDVIKAEDKPIQEKLHGMDARSIALLTKGRPAEFIEKILSNISANRRVEVRAESDYMGPVPKKDAEDAINAFMTWFRAAREEGKILLLGDELVE